MDNDQRIAEITARCEAATPGPWEYDGMAFIWHDTEHGKQMILDTRGHGYLTDTLGLSEEQAAQIMDDNGKFAAAAREDLPWALNIIAAQQAQIDRLTEAQRWIPVEEGLPKTNKPVQVYMPKLYMSIQTGFYDRYYGEDDSEWYEHWVAPGEVTHWMPLPAAPEEGE